MESYCLNCTALITSIAFEPENPAIKFDYTSRTVVLVIASSLESTSTLLATQNIVDLVVGARDI